MHFHRFDEESYLAAHLDVASAVLRTEFVSGEHHFIAYGRAEGRFVLNRVDPTNGRILITGTGRAGTTLLVQILTSLGFNTGFSQEQALSNVDAVSHAGLEHVLSPTAPLVVKSPWLADTLAKDLKQPWCKVSFAVVPIRNLFEAAESRRCVSRIALARGADPFAATGGLWHTNQFDKQEEALLNQFYKAIFALVQHNIMPLFVEFPRFALDCEYLFDNLRVIWETYGVSAAELKAVFDNVVDVDKIGQRS